MSANAAENYDTEKLARMRTVLQVKMAALKGVSDSRISTQHAAREQAAEAVQVSGIRAWDARRPISELLETLQADHDEMADDPRRAGTCRKIAAAMLKARAAISARNQADALALHMDAVQAEVTPLHRLVSACDAWIAEGAK